MVALDVVPDLAVEIVSPSNSADEIIGELAEYLGAGVRQAWVIYTSRRIVYVYSSAETVQIIGAGGTLGGDEVLPGFTLPLAELCRSRMPAG